MRNYTLMKTRLFFSLFFSFMILSHCSSSGGEEVTLPGRVAQSSDTTAPTFDGAASVTGNGADSIVINWTQASDDVTAAANMTYLVCYSSTQGECVSNFTTKFTTAEGATSHTVNGLSGSTTYYAVVRAKDEAGNIDSNITERSSITAGWFTFLGVTNKVNKMYDIEVTNDGGVLLMMTTTEHINLGVTPILPFKASTSEYNKLMLVKLSSSGSVEWQTYFNSSGVDYTSGADIHATSDGFYLLLNVEATTPLTDLPDLGGATSILAYNDGKDILLIKITTAGQVSWYTYLGGSGNESGNGLCTLADGSVIVAALGFADISSLGPVTGGPLVAYKNGGDTLLIKMSSGGIVQQYTFFGGSYWENPTGIACSSSDQVVIAAEAHAPASSEMTAALNAHSAGSSASSATQNDILTASFNSSLSPQWYTYAGSIEADDKPKVAISDSAIYVTGTADNTFNINSTGPLQAHADNSNTGGDFAVIKYDTSGNYQWHNLFGTSGDDLPGDIVISGTQVLVAGEVSGNIAGYDSKSPIYDYVGTTAKDIAILSFDANGSASWYSFYGSTAIDSVARLSIGNSAMFLAGQYSSNISSFNNTSPLQSSGEAGTHSDIAVFQLKTNGEL